MDSVFQNFKDVISRAQAADFPDLARLILRDKIATFGDRDARDRPGERVGAAQAALK